MSMDQQRKRSQSVDSDSDDGDEWIPEVEAPRSKPVSQAQRKRLKTKLDKLLSESEVLLKEQKESMASPSRRHFKKLHSINEQQRNAEKELKENQAAAMANLKHAYAKKREGAEKDMTKELDTIKAGRAKGIALRQAEAAKIVEKIGLKKCGLCAKDFYTGDVKKQAKDGC